MSLIGNILWIVLGGGIIIFFQYLVGSLALILTIVGIPFGVQTLKLSYLALLPFGKRVVNVPSSTGLVTTVLNVIWLIFGGIWIALTHLLFALLCAITIIGLPFAKQHVKLAALGLTPFGKSIQ